ncbi:MAG: prolyl-tRNA synthetase associated domain-containing protein [Candidatus Liptonbacteria bacterium]|nr:prolyl-tRNA synthetase associated domain-containing protein [Candidatus Liptonbacteria bacterium]
MPKDPLVILAQFGIPYERYDHPAVFTCEEAEEKASFVPGVPAKNLFLESGKSGKIYLVTLTYNKRANLKHLSEFLGEKKLHFGSAEKLLAVLGVTPGAVSPLGLVNDEQHAVTYVLDRDFLQEELINMHPNDNTASLVLAVPDFLRFLDHIGCSPHMYRASR